MDLDGSLIATDLLWESFLALLRSRPWSAPRACVWALRGRAHLKRQLAARVELDVATLPYHDEVIEFLRQRRAEGRRLVLTTAADEHLARAVADHVGLFDEIIASDGRSNLKGRVKLREIEARFGSHGFDYVGNGSEDLPIWESAGEVVVVRPGRRLLRRVRSDWPSSRVFERPGNRPDAWLRTVRAHQWSKNILLFVPLIAAHRLGEWRLVLDCLVAFFAFNLAASAIYILNDLMDLPSDRLHPRKRLRPLASGLISIPAGAVTSLGLLGASIGLACLTSLTFLGWLLLYVATSTAYTFLLKRKIMIDVLCLAGLYTLRILAGGAATGIPISSWLMAFSMFMFLSLGFVKRYTELAALVAQHGRWLPGRGYRDLDLDMIRSVGPASGYLAVLVVCLYVNDRSSVELYRHPKWLWMLCPVILYWISRVWFLAHRGQVDSDPVVFALRDKKSLLAGLIGVVIVVAARWL